MWHATALVVHKRYALKQNTIRANKTCALLHLTTATLVMVQTVLALFSRHASPFAAVLS